MRAIPLHLPPCVLCPYTTHERSAHPPVYTPCAVPSLSLLSLQIRDRAERESGWSYLTVRDFV